MQDGPVETGPRDHTVAGGVTAATKNIRTRPDFPGRD